MAQEVVATVNEITDDRVAVGDVLPDPLDPTKDVRVARLERAGDLPWPKVVFIREDGAEWSTGWPAFARAIAERWKDQYG